MQVIKEYLLRKNTKSINFNNKEIIIDEFLISKFDLKMNKNNLSKEFQKSSELLRNKIDIK